MTMLSIDELAARLRTTPNALYCRYHRDRHTLPPVITIPGDKRKFFDADVVEQWIKNPAAFMPQPKRGPGRPRKSS
jgi:hypothetical protein